MFREVGTFSPRGKQRLFLRPSPVSFSLLFGVILEALGFTFGTLGSESRHFRDSRGGLCSKVHRRSFRIRGGSPEGLVRRADYYLKGIRPLPPAPHHSDFWISRFLDSWTIGFSNSWILGLSDAWILRFLNFGTLRSSAPPCHGH